MTPAVSPKPAGVVLKYVVALAAVVLAAYVVWGLRTLIVPMFVGGVLAYICRPVVARLERAWLPRGLAVGLLLLMFASVALVIANSVRARATSCRCSASPTARRSSRVSARGREWPRRSAR